MIKDILKILWNYRKLYLGIYIEQLCVFIILMISIVSLIGAINQYNSPGLLDTDDVLSFGYIIGAKGFQDKEVQKDVVNKMDIIADRLSREPYVTAISDNLQLTPYMRDDHQYARDSVLIDRKKYLIYIKGADDKAEKVYKPKVIEGKWFDNSYLHDGNIPIVITKQLADLVGWNQSVGRTIDRGEGKLEVIGVVAGVKQTAFNESPPAIIFPIASVGSTFFREMAVRLKSGYKDDFLAKFHKEFTETVDEQSASPFSMDLDVTRKFYMKDVTFQIAMYLIPTLFLFVFAFIGTLGLFLVVTKRRLSEYAVRIALGTTKMKLQMRIIAEGLIISTAACIPGIVLGLSVYEMTALNMLSIIATLVIMQLFSILSVWYAAHKIVDVQPTEILRQE